MKYITPYVYKKGPSQARMVHSYNEKRFDTD